MATCTLVSPEICCRRCAPRQRTLLWMTTAAFIICLLSSLPVAATTSARQLLPSSSFSHWGLSRSSSGYSLPSRIFVPRGGSSVEEEEDEYDDEEYDSEDEEESEAEDEDQGAQDKAEEDDSDGVQIEMKVEKYDDPLFPSPMANLYCSLGVMLLARKIDLFNPTVVKLARAFFIAYLIIHQLLILYVRIQAKSINDRTPIELKNPLSTVLQSQLDATGGSAGMMKNLASSFLSSKSTVVEYDLKQARSMQSGLIFSMLFMWFLHFKMGQVQPLLINSLSGLLNLAYSPLFQVYILGRNLERPFKNLAAIRAEEAAQKVEVDEESASDDAQSTAAEIETIAEESDEEPVEQEDQADTEPVADDDVEEEEEDENTEDDAEDAEVDADEEEGKETEVEKEAESTTEDGPELTEDKGRQEETAADEIESTEIADEEDDVKDS